MTSSEPDRVGRNLFSSTETCDVSLKTFLQEKVRVDSQSL